MPRPRVAYDEHVTFFAERDVGVGGFEIMTVCSGAGMDALPF